MTMQRVDTRRAYDLILERITRLDLAPGSPINEQRLAGDLNLPLTSIEEALKLLEHEHLVRITPRHGIYVADINIPDLEQISELRLALETLVAGLAAQRATPDDLIVLEALRQEQLNTGSQDARRLFDVDHKFHQAVAEAAHNIYLAETLNHLFGLSLRFWYLLLPADDATAPLEALPAAVEKHFDLVNAIRSHDAAAAQEIMRSHVGSFYQAVRRVLAARTPAAPASSAAGEP